MSFLQHYTISQVELWDLVERHCPSVNRSDPNTWFVAHVHFEVNVVCG